MLGIVFLPLMPIGFEWAISGSLRLQTMAISAAMFAAGKGIESPHALTNVLCVIIAIAMSVAFGLAVKEIEMVGLWGPIVCILAVTWMHASERYELHVLEKKPFRT